jgi:hypothetical protein
MFANFRNWLWKAYPRRDRPLLRGHRPRSVRLTTAEIVEIRYFHQVYDLTEELVNELMKLHTGELQ